MTSVSTNSPSTIYSSENSIRDVINEKLDELQKTTRELFQTLLQTTKRESTPRQVTQYMQRLVSIDADFKKCIQNLKQRQQFQSKITSVQKEIHQVDDDIIRLMNQLREAENKITSTLKMVRPQLDAMDEAEKQKADVDDLIHYAKNISPFSSAPVDWLPTDIHKRIQPPYPLETIMRKGLIYRHFQQLASDTQLVEEEKEPHSSSERKDDIDYGDVLMEDAEELLDLDLN